MTWTWNRNAGFIVLAIWLIASGLAAFVHVSFLNMGLILSLVAIVAGVLILLGR